MCIRDRYVDCMPTYPLPVLGESVLNHIKSKVNLPKSERRYEWIEMYNGMVSKIN